MTEVNVVALVKMKPENIKDAQPLTRELVQHCRAQPGCLKYEVHSVKDKEGVYVVFETFKDQAAFQVHRAAEHLTSWRAACKDFFAQGSVVAVLQKAL